MVFDSILHGIRADALAGVSGFHHTCTVVVAGSRRADDGDLPGRLNTSVGSP